MLNVGRLIISRMLHFFFAIDSFFFVSDGFLLTQSNQRPHSPTPSEMTLTIYNLREDLSFLREFISIAQILVW